MVKSLDKKRDTFVVFKCPYNKCNLFYDSILGLKRHIAGYNHKLFFLDVMSNKCPQYDCAWTTSSEDSTDIDKHIQQDHPKKNANLMKEMMNKAKKILQIDEYISEQLKESEKPKRSRIKKDTENSQVIQCLTGTVETPFEEDNQEVSIGFESLVEGNTIIFEILNFFFTNGVTKMNDLDKPDLFFCGIPGCGKHFKSIMAYKYHCNTYSHSFFSLYDAFCRLKNIELDYEPLRCILIKNFQVEDKFNLLGIAHHSTFSPDQTFPIVFSISKDYVIRTKRPQKREMNVTEYNNLFTDDFSITELSDQFESIPLKISFRGQRYDPAPSNAISHFKFLNTKEEITTSYRFRNIFCVCTKESNQKEKKIFEFFSEKSSIIFFENKQEVKRFNFTTGFIRKIIIQNIISTYCFFSLSNDGFVRYYNNNSVLIEFPQSKITSFTILDNYKDEEIILCDSFQLYKYKSGVLTTTSTKFKFPVLSIEARTSENEEQEIYLLDANGKIFFCSSDFRNEQEIYTNVGTTNFIYLKDLDGLLLCDSFLGITKIMYLQDKNKKVSVLHSNFTSCAENHNKSILTGTFNGQVTTSQISKSKKIAFENIFKIVRRKDHFILCCEERELEHFSYNSDIEFDLSVCMIFVYHINSHFVLGLSNGFIIFVET